jgi:uncharacterized membrane protein
MHMKNLLIAYFSSLLPMMVMDGIWLTTMAKRFYGAHIGHLLAESFRPAPAVLFYAVYALGVSVLVVLPAVAAGTGSGRAFLLGAMLGLFGYATYDLTSQATLRDWPTIVTIVDLAWGTLMTGTISSIATAITRRLA